MAGSIPVRLRYQGFRLVLGRDPGANRRPPLDWKPVQVRLETIVGPLFEDDTAITFVELLGEAIGG